MENDKFIEVLSSYIRYRSGRGRKYAEPNCPYGSEVVTQALRDALRIAKTSVKFASKIK